MIGICGPPGAGKSTLADQIATELNPGMVAVVPFDGFHLASNLLIGTHLAARRGAIDTFDLRSYLVLIQRLRARTDDVVYAPSFVRHIEEPIAASIAVPRDVPLILTEGNYLLADDPDLDEVRSILDEVWFLEVADDVRMAQLVARHVEFGKAEDAAAAWAAGTDQRNADIVAATRHRADLIISLEAPR